MKIVIQCAGTKNAQRPGSGFHASDGRLVKFVADPKDAPSISQYAYVRPDDLSDGHHTWRERLLEYNKEANSNSLGLLPAYRLYARKVYEDLVGKFGTNQVFILSAGWGLIASDFLTPDYREEIPSNPTPGRDRRVTCHNDHSVEMLINFF